jgi:O-antigen biosynthesis protein
VLPVKDGERYLEELLAALALEAVDEVLVIDSGSTDRSLEIAASAGVEVLRIDPAEYGHGRTRNLGAERTAGELICFLTQDATPCPGWLDAYREAFQLAPDVGAAFGPHLPRADTSPMIARELEQFFAGFSSDGTPVVQRKGDRSFLSNVNACYLRGCWEQVRFRDLPYAEDQAFGSDMFERGWAKVFHPAAAVLHAHDYGPLEFMRRYFDEYRGLRDSIGHVEPIGVRSAVRDVKALVAADLGWMRERRYSHALRARWALRASTHHAGRKVFSALGSRADRLSPALRRRLSHEGSGHAPPPAQSDVGCPAHPPAARPPVKLAHQQAKLTGHGYEQVARVLRDGPAPLADPVSRMADRARLHLAFVIPPFSEGSGGHNIICQLMLRLERRGHTCGLWLADDQGRMRDVWPGRIRDEVRRYFAPLQGPVHKGFSEWHGADVVIATGWQTVYPVLALEGARARAYLINDHEPEFYSTSVESIWAARTYAFGLHGICGSPWLRDLYVQRYGGAADLFDYGVDHDVYHPREVSRRRDTVVFYCRAATPRRAVALGVMALHQLHRRRPDLRIMMFGDAAPISAPFPYEHIGVATPEQLSWTFSEATVGLCLSLTNYSLIPQEMLACGLPCVDLEGASAESVFGANGPVELAPLDDVALADHLQRVLEDRGLWQWRSQAGVDFVAARTWDRAADQVEAGLRHALSKRERAASLSSHTPTGR